MTSQSMPRPDVTAATDQRLADAIVLANYRITLNNQKQNARLRLEKDLTFSANGGIFKINPELISFVQTLLTAGYSETVLLDTNKNPISIDNLEEFQSSIIDKYHECMNGFMVEFKSIQKARTTQALIGG